MTPLLNALIYEAQQRKQVEATCQMQSQLSRHEVCLNNFRDLHGFDPAPEMNMYAILRDYGLPWRKTSIPKVNRKRAKQ